MDIDINTWTAIASLIVNILALFPRNKGQRDEKQQQALLAVSEAYHETAAYLEARKAEGRDREREWRIAGKWDKAAGLLRIYDVQLSGRLSELSGRLKELSGRLGAKGQFWRDGGNWDQQAIEEGGIALTPIWREVKALLGTEADPPEDDIEPSKVELIRFLCPNCGKRCKAPVEAGGRTARCPRCGIFLEVPGPSKEAEQWYYAQDGRRVGPISTSELRKMVHEGKLSSNDLLWKNGMASWMPVRNLKWD